MSEIAPPRNLTPGLCKKIEAEMLKACAEVAGKHGLVAEGRDMFDIAATAQALGHDGLVAALKPFAAECEAALNVAQHSDPMFTKATLSQLIVREGFVSLYETAREQTCDLLKAVIQSPR